MVQPTNAYRCRCDQDGGHGPAGRHHRTLTEHTDGHHSTRVDLTSDILAWARTCTNERWLLSCGTIESEVISRCLPNDPRWFGKSMAAVDDNTETAAAEEQSSSTYAKEFPNIDQSESALAALPPPAGLRGPPRQRA